MPKIRCASGTRIEVKGSRNYTTRVMYVGTDEIYEDVAIRGLRADGLSSKLGIKNNKGSIGKVLPCFKVLVLFCATA